MEKVLGLSLVQGWHSGPKLSKSITKSEDGHVLHSAGRCEQPRNPQRELRVRTRKKDGPRNVCLRKRA